VTQDLKRLLGALATTSIILTVLVLPAAGQRKSEVATQTFSEAPYFVGERLTYNVSFSNFVSAAHVELFVAGVGLFWPRRDPTQGSRGDKPAWSTLRFTR